LEKYILIIKENLKRTSKDGEKTFKYGGKKKISVYIV